VSLHDLHTAPELLPLPLLLLLLLLLSGQLVGLVSNICNKWNSRKEQDITLIFLFFFLRRASKPGLLRLWHCQSDSLATQLDANKNYFFLSFSANYFMKVHLHHFSKLKSHKEVTKQ
jgi:hypothetical protein